MSEYKTISADVEVCLDEWTEEELIEYLDSLGYTLATPEDIDWLAQLADAKFYNHPEKFDELFSEYVYQKLGRVV